MNTVCGYAKPASRQKLEQANKTKVEKVQNIKHRAQVSRSKCF
jgi:hypothetical protein